MIRADVTCSVWIKTERHFLESSKQLMGAGGCGGVSINLLPALLKSGLKEWN